jgi:hypothetical protein
MVALSEDVGPSANQTTHPQLLESLVSPLSDSRQKTEAREESVGRVPPGLEAQTVWKEMGGPPGVSRTLPNLGRSCRT